MLREELKDKDIPHRTMLRKRIDEILEQHLIQLERDMSVCYQASLVFIIAIDIGSEICWENFVYH